MTAATLDAPAPPGLTYARVRLLLGITGVGGLVLWATAAVVFGVPFREEPTTAGNARVLAAAVAAYALWMTPWDWLGGFVAPRRYGRSTQTAAAFAAGWLRGVAVQAALFVAFGLLIIEARVRLGPGFGTAAFAAIAVLLLLVQRPLAKLVGGLATDRRVEIAGRRCEVLRHSDPGFTGGVAGVPARVLLPRRWTELLSGDELAAVVARRGRVIDSGGLLAGRLAALSWNVAGFALCVHLPGGGAASAAALFGAAAWFTLWSFLGLLTLPTLSRRATQSLDRSLPPATAAALATALPKLDASQDDEPRRPAWVETIFHPVPALTARDAADADADATTGPDAPEPAGPTPPLWHVARTAVYLSWAGLNPLARAVHCNAGRVENWVLLPTD